MFSRIRAAIQAKALQYLAIALFVSLLANGTQFLVARTVAAEHAATLAKIETDKQTAIAEHETTRANTLGELTLATTQDAQLIRAQLKALSDQVGRANRKYQEATRAIPLPVDCRADAERVRAVNAARGQE